MVNGRVLSAVAWPLRWVGKGLVLTIDWVQRKLLGIVEFSSDPDCIARIAESVSRTEVTLPDGTRVQPGERMGEIHLWNERAPKMSASGPDMAWALAFRRKIVKSLRELASYVEENPAFDDIRVFHGGTSFVRRNGLTEALTGGDLASRLGFYVVRPPAADGLSRNPSVPRVRLALRRFLLRFRDFWENLYYLALVWAYNPRSLATKGLGRLERVELYISKAALIERYGSCARPKMASEAREVSRSPGSNR